MKTPPEAFLIFKEELQKQKEENKRLRDFYDGKLSDLTEEILLLRERISSQRGMLENTVEYAMRLEEEVKELRNQMKEDTNPNRSYH